MGEKLNLGWTIPLTPSVHHAKSWQQGDALFLFRFFIYIFFIQRKFRWWEISMRMRWHMVQSAYALQVPPALGDARCGARMWSRSSTQGIQDEHCGWRRRVFLLLQFIRVLGLANKKYSTVSFIFYGPLAEWALGARRALSARLHTRASMCTSACCRFCFFVFLKKTSRWLENISPPFPFFLILCSLWAFARITWLPHDITGGWWIMVCVRACVSLPEAAELQ